MKMRLFLNQKRTKEKGERQRDKLPFFFVENFFGGVPPLTKFSGAIRYTESVKAAWKRLCEEAVWGILSLLH